MTGETNKWRVSYQRTIEYEVVNSPNIFHPQNPSLLSVGKRENTRRFVIVDSNVEALYSSRIRDYFRLNNIDARIVSVPAGEENKSAGSYLSILQELDRFPINRRDEPIIAIGGGVLTDVAGFVASSYRRGVPHVKVPTTLMGYVDASIGIKTGINFNEHKNRLGSFEPPKKVFLDRALLKTLPKRHILNGVCEIIKLAVIKDASLFAMLETHGMECVAEKFQGKTGESILDRAVGGMLEELQPNLFEDDLARRVDFGHTFSYGLETHHDARLLHGEAVLIDIVLSSFLANARNILPEAGLNRILNLVAKLGMDINGDLIEAGLLWETLEERTYHRNGLQRVPLPGGIGQCVFVNDVKFEEIQSACKMLKNWTVIHDSIYQY